MTSHVKPAGGTELMCDGLVRHCGESWDRLINIIVSGANPSVIDPTRINVLWQHLMPDDAVTSGMADPDLISSIDQFIYVSEWQMARFAEAYPMAGDGGMVMLNAIDPIEFKPKPPGPPRLIYTSTPFRGLEILLDAFDLMRHDDAELTVYSSDIIYGTSFALSAGDAHKRLFDRCRSHPRIDYRGYAPNPEVRAAVGSAHIFAYPSCFVETSCLSAIEAGAAGCRIVTTNLGALPETCGPFATYVPYGHDHADLARRYAAALDDAVSSYNPNGRAWRLQSDWFNDRYGWQGRARQWESLFDRLTDGAWRTAHQ